MTLRTVRVELPAHAYDVLVGPGAAREAARRTPAMLRRGAGRCFLLVDTGVPDAFVSGFERDLRGAGFDPVGAELTPSEPDKSLATFTRIVREVAGAALDRFEPVFALGGGIVGDVAGFVAASYRRGVPVVQCPTTLLAMVDASVGGKTGVNLDVGAPGPTALLKNAVGAFWQPALVAADVDALASLDEREYRCGLAECVKHGMIARTAAVETDLLDFLEASVAPIRARDPGVLTELVARDVALKAAVVAGDEREQTPSAGRAMLNLGHTFGHAIETLPDARPAGGRAAGGWAEPPLRHGEAVAIGLVAACRCAENLGLIDGALASRTAALLDGFGLPVSAAALPDAPRVLARMGHDKKVVGGTLRLVLPTGPGTARVVDGPDADAVLDALRFVGAS